MPTDLQAIQGYWRVVSYTSRGGAVTSGTTHYHFDGNRVKEIDPFFVDGGTWATFELGTRHRPKRFTMTYEFPQKGGGTRRQVHEGLYDLTGKKLRICWPNVYGTIPKKLSDKEDRVVTLARHVGPPPPTKQASG